MTLTPYQIIAPAIALVAIIYAWNLAMRQKKTVWEACLWTLSWGLIGGIALFPNFLSYLSTATGIQNRENAVMVTFLGILFFIVFYIIIRLEELEQRHAKMVRDMALWEAGLGKESKEVKETKESKE